MGYDFVSKNIDVFIKKTEIMDLKTLLKLLKIEILKYICQVKIYNKNYSPN